MRSSAKAEGIALVRCIEVTGRNSILMQLQEGGKWRWWELVYILFRFFFLFLSETENKGMSQE